MYLELEAGQVRNERGKGHLEWREKVVRVGGWGVLIYKSVSDLNVTIGQPRDLNFLGRTTFTGSNFFVVCIAHVKNFPFNFLVFHKEIRKKT